MDSDEPQDEEPVYTFTWTESKQPSLAVVLAIAEVTGEDPTAIEPLYNVLDPDSLDRLFAATKRPRLAGTVQFRYHGYQITLTADGRGFVYDHMESEISTSPPL